MGGHFKEHLPSQLIRVKEERKEMEEVERETRLGAVTGSSSLPGVTGSSSLPGLFSSHSI